MSHDKLDAIRQVLIEAAQAPNLFDLSDAERLDWMIERAFVIGAQSVNADTADGPDVESRKALTCQPAARRPRGRERRKP